MKETKEQFYLIHAESSEFDDYCATILSIPCGDLHGVVENMVKRELGVGLGDVIVIRGVQVAKEEIETLLVPRRAQYREDQRQQDEAAERATYERLKAKFEGNE